MIKSHDKVDALMRDRHGNNIFASMLAEEDVRVIMKNCSTAYADLKTRNVYIPFWRVSKMTGLALRIHEVAHLLHTPMKEWSAAVDCKHPDVAAAGIKRGRGFKSYLNILEDIRIERLMGKAYPGARNILQYAHIELYKSGLYDDPMGLKPHERGVPKRIDRILLNERLGADQCPVPLQLDDAAHATAAAQLNTFEDVVQLAIKLWEYQSQQPDEQDDSDSLAFGNPEAGDSADEGDSQDSDSSGSSDEHSDDGEQASAKSKPGADSGDSSDDADSNSAGDESSDNDADADTTSKDGDKPQSNAMHKSEQGDTDNAASDLDQFQRNNESDVLNPADVTIPEQPIKIGRINKRISKFFLDCEL